VFSHFHDCRIALKGTYRTIGFHPKRVAVKCKRLVEIRDDVTEIPNSHDGRDTGAGVCASANPAMQREAAAQTNTFMISSFRNSRKIYHDIPHAPL
jgi:hypothetical protein